MTADINSWNLNYSDFSGSVIHYDFGQLSDDSPFQVQMEIGDADRTNVDQQHATDDAILMGRDLLGGRDLTFTLTTVPDPNDLTPEDTALDKISEFAAIWRAFYTSKQPGQYAILTNNHRSRFVWGRPRNFSPKNAQLRRGVVQYIAVFHAITPDFYKTPAVDLSPVRTVSLPWAVGGDIATFPRITFTGPFSTASLTWTPGGLFTPWTITLNHALLAHDQVEIDTRPWIRSATGTGNEPRNGWLAGSKMADCFLTPNPSGAFLFATTGSTSGVTACDIEYNEAYAGL